MTFGNGIGCDIEINGDMSAHKILFSETGGFLLVVAPDRVNAVTFVFSKYGVDVFQIGSTGGNSIQINGVVDLSVNEAKEAWTNGLREKL